jgi:hypothetical protein
MKTRRRLLLVGSRICDEFFFYLLDIKTDDFLYLRSMNCGDHLPSFRNICSFVQKMSGTISDALARMSMLFSKLDTKITNAYVMTRCSLKD